MFGFLMVGMILLIYSLLLYAYNVLVVLTVLLVIANKRSWFFNKLPNDCFNFRWFVLFLVFFESVAVALMCRVSKSRWIAKANSEYHGMSANVHDHRKRGSKVSLIASGLRIQWWQAVCGSAKRNEASVRLTEGVAETPSWWWVCMLRLLQAGEGDVSELQTKRSLFLEISLRIAPRGLSTVFNGFVLTLLKVFTLPYRLIDIVVGCS